MSIHNYNNNATDILMHNRQRFNLPFNIFMFLYLNLYIYVCIELRICNQYALMQKFIHFWFCEFHSHASLPSKLLKAIANACKAHKGYRKSIVNTSSDVRPNCITIYSGSESWTNWKFFTDACVTRPWKFKTYDCVSSFQTGVLLCNSTTLSIFCLRLKSIERERKGEMIYMSV